MVTLFWGDVFPSVTTMGVAIVERAGNKVIDLSHTVKVCFIDYRGNQSRTNSGKGEGFKAPRNETLRRSKVLNFL